LEDIMLKRIHVVVAAFVALPALALAPAQDKTAQAKSVVQSETTEVTVAVP
jgi:hypothetical protein